MRCEDCDTELIPHEDRIMGRSRGSFHCPNPDCAALYSVIKRGDDRVAKAIFKNIADGFDERGHFLQAFARLFMKASEQNQQCLLPAAHALNEHYQIEKDQREKGILTDISI